MTAHPAPTFAGRLSNASEADALRDRTLAWIGPLLPGDREMLAEGYLELSEESKRRRFLTAIPELTPPLLDRLVDQVDGIDHVALLVFVEVGAALHPVAIGRIVRYSEMPDTADIAFTVKDAWHGKGIATLLARRLCENAPEGITHLLTEVAADNPAPLAILGKLGVMQVHSAGDGVLDVEVALSGEHLRLTPPPEGQRLHPLLAQYAQQILHMRDLVCEELLRLTPLQWPAETESVDSVDAGDT